VCHTVTTIAPQGFHILATIFATHSTHCSHMVATLLPECRHTVHTASWQPDLIAQIIFSLVYDYVIHAIALADGGPRVC
jgi:hypothetical protein